MFEKIIFTKAEIARYYAVRVPDLNQQRGPAWRGPCPVHGGKDDNFAVNAETGYAFCHSQCGRGWDIIKLEMELSGVDFKAAKRIVFEIIGRPDEYPSEGPTGAPAPRGFEGARRAAAAKGFVHVTAEYCFGDSIRKVRIEHASAKQAHKDGRPEKTFLWEHRRGNEWFSGLGGLKVPLYQNNLPGGIIIGVEGPAKADQLAEIGVAAFSFKELSQENADQLNGSRIVLWPDADDEGRKAAFRAAKTLLKQFSGSKVSNYPPAFPTFCTGPEAVRSVSIIEPPSDVWKGWDVLDAIRSGWDAERILRAAADAPRITPEVVADAEWPQPEDMGPRLPAVLPFPVGALPARLAPLVRDVTERMQSPVDYAAIAVITCLAGVVSRRMAIQPRVNDTGWIVIPNLWGALIGVPAFKKSPVISAVTAPIRAIQANWMLEHEDAMKLYFNELKKYKLRVQVWEQQYKAAIKNGSVPPPEPDDEPAAPILRRIIINDATPEALHATLSGNPAGVLILRDELTGWLTQMDKPGREGERQMHIEAWDGDGTFVLDRIGRGTIISNMCESVLGGIQPGRLRSYLADALNGGPSDDGFIQRLQLAVWPDTDRGYIDVDRAPDKNAEFKAERAFKNLLGVDPQNRILFRFADGEAQDLFDDWHKALQVRVRSGELSSAMSSHLGKYAKLMPALALLFELVDRSKDDPVFTVTWKHAEQAAEMCTYLESHANRIYSCFSTPRVEAARDLSEKIKDRSLGGVFTCRDVYRKCWSGLDSPEAAALALKDLEDAGWLRSAPGNPGANKKAVMNYEVNPRVWP